MITTSL